MNTPLRSYLSHFSRSSPAYGVHKIASRYIRDRALRYFSGSLLDIGCGAKEKGVLINELVESHIGLDHPVTLHDKAKINIFGTAYCLPMQDETVDCVLCTAVLEHLEEPQMALAEACRVLKVGGYALYTVPLFWHVHERPRDFFRYTEHGLHYLFQKAGFVVQEVTPLSGFLMTFGTEFGYYIQRFRIGPMKYLVDTVVAINSWLLPKIDRGILRDENFTWMYLVIAQKTEKFVRK